MRFPINNFDQINFDQWIIFDWYDGIVHGIAKSQHDQAWYRLALTAWDIEQDVKFYVIIPIDISYIESLKSLVSPIGEEKNWILPSDDRARALIKSLDQNLLKNEPHHIVILKTRSLDEQAIAIKQVEIKTIINNIDLNKDIEMILEHSVRDFDIIFT
ncbi:hypothetical protein KKF91_12005 [Myxococcota bacterium]|nr:hypothetical protein [Myxococcota bacterium]MBU1431254.1 hypothetical protein [Myxococcota bacterium]MBU1898057.1 hypothetical protein [Myxococcota bacterium]